MPTLTASSVRALAASGQRLADSGGSGRFRIGWKDMSWSATASHPHHIETKRSSEGRYGHRRMIMEMPETEVIAKRPVWNAGRTVGVKRALRPKQIWGIRFHLNQRRRLRDRALFDLAIDSKLRGAIWCRCRSAILSAADRSERGQS
jgi:hypothetical protein